MTDRETTVLSSRLQSLADDMTPQLDVVAQVKAARALHRRRRQGPIMILAAATATAAVAVGSVAAADVLSAGGGDGEVAGPSVTTSASPSSPTTTSTPTTTPPPTTTPTTTATATPTATDPVTPVAPLTPSTGPGSPIGPLEGWASRSFHGVTFAVPPGARSADTVDTTPVSAEKEGPRLTWNGPSLGGNEFSYVEVTIGEPFEGGLTPTDGGEYFDVPGAELAYGGITSVSFTGEPLDTRTVWMHLLAGDRQIIVSAVFPGGPAGDQMAQRLIASLAIA